MSSDLYADHSSRTAVAAGFSIALPAIAVPLRIWSRRRQELKLGADDYMIMFAAFMTICNAIVPIYANKYGNGRHEEIVPKEDLNKYFLVLFVFEQTFGVAICAVKLSVLLFYRRVFSTRPFKRWTLAIGILCVLWLIVKNLIGAFQCSPVKKAWIHSTPGHCPINFINIVLGAQAFNAFFDIIILCLPITAVLRLHLPLGKRIAVASIFAVGLFTIVIAITRLAVIAHEVLKYGPKLPDVTWYTAKFSWTALDPAVGCFVACMPTWWPLVLSCRNIPSSLSSLRIRLSKMSGHGSRHATPITATPGGSGETFDGQYQAKTTSEAKHMSCDKAHGGIMLEPESIILHSEVTLEHQVCPRADSSDAGNTSVLAKDEMRDSGSSVDQPTPGEQQSHYTFF